jgi:hypothetical protein
MTDLTTINVTLDRLNNKKRDLITLSNIIAITKKPYCDNSAITVNSSVVIASEENRTTLGGTLLGHLLPNAQLLENALALEKKLKEEIEKIEQVLTALTYALAPLMDESK